MGNSEDKDKYRGGAIWIHRRILDWEWYTDSVTMRVFIHCLLRANWKDGKWRGIEIKRGSFVTSRKHLANELNISEQEVRTAIEHLVSTNELTKSAHAKYTVITVVRYDEYQQSNQQNNQASTNKSTDNQPSSNQVATTNEKGNKGNKGINKIQKPPHKGWIPADSHSARYVLDHPSSEGWRIEVVNGKEWGYRVKQ